MNWQALQVYHPLWEAQALQPVPQPLQRLAIPLMSSSLSLPETTLQPMSTPESERRRQRLSATTAHQQASLNVRLQAMEARLLQSEMASLDSAQKAEMEAVRQQSIRDAERAIEEALSQHQSQQASAEIRRRVIQRLLRVRPDQRDLLQPKLEEVQAAQESLSAHLQHRLMQIEEETLRRIRERTDAIEKEYEQRRHDLRERSARRLQAEQLRASAQIRAFADNGKPITFERVAIPLPASPTVPTSPAPVVASQDLNALIERDVKRWIEAVCRRHRWLPAWQPETGVPDVTSQIAEEVRGRT